MSELYDDNKVRARIVEYLGGSTVQEATAVYLMGSDFSKPEDLYFRPVDQIDYYLDERRDISRSLWDRKSLVVHLDIEYVNFDFKAEPYLNMKRCFKLQQPVVETVERLLLEHGIAPLHLVSGRGHHFVWKIKRDGEAFGRIAGFGRVSEALAAVNAEAHEPAGIPVEPELGNAFSGLGLIMEHLAYRIKEEASKTSAIPVEITDLYVGPGKNGREMISIDLSEYGDPLHTRMMRIPFTAYRKPWEKGIADDPNLPKPIPLLYMIPLHEMDIFQALETMKDPSAIRSLAARASTAIPDQEDGMERLADDYSFSRTRVFHDWFYAQDHEPPWKWPDTYDRTPFDGLAHCARRILENPNDALLKPAGIQFVVRTMLALGWHPRHIAGLIRSKYERDFGWGPLWFRYNATARADFYTRIFTGQFVTERDDLVSFNCISAKEMGLCFDPEVLCDVHRYRDSLLARRKHDRLACGPFNRLFLP